MTDTKDSINALLGKLRHERDELKLQLNLAKLEAREEWEDLERKWERLEERLADAGEEAKESLDDLGEATAVVADELKSAYKRIRERLND